MKPAKFLQLLRFQPISNIYVSTEKHHPRFHDPWSILVAQQRRTTDFWRRCTVDVVVVVVDVLVVVVEVLVISALKPHHNRGGWYEFPVWRQNSRWSEFSGRWLKQIWGPESIFKHPMVKKNMISDEDWQIDRSQSHTSASELPHRRGGRHRGGRHGGSGGGGCGLGSWKKTDSSGGLATCEPLNYCWGG